MGLRRRVFTLLIVVISSHTAASDRCKPEDRFPHDKGSPIYYTCKFRVKSYDYATTPNYAKHHPSVLFSNLRYINYYVAKVTTTEKSNNYYDTDLYHYSVKFHSDNGPDSDAEMEGNEGGGFDSDVQWNYEYLTRIFPGIGGKPESRKTYGGTVTPFD